MSFYVQDYQTSDAVCPYHAMTLDGAWDHKKPWLWVEQHCDLVAAYRDLWKTNKDQFWNVENAVHYGMVNT